MLYFLLVWFGLGFIGGLYSTLSPTWRKSGVNTGDKSVDSYEAGDVVECLLFTIIGFFGFMLGLVAWFTREERAEYLEINNL